MWRRHSLSVDTRTRIKLGIATVALLVPAFAVASHYGSEAQKYFDKNCARPRQFGITAFVCDLRERLDALTTRVDTLEELPGIPGPPGPQGGTGAVGPQGPQGEQGLPGIGQALKIFDANGELLGLLVERFSFYYAPIDRIIDIRMDTPAGRVGNPIDAYYTSSNCTGTAYRRFTSNYNESVNTLMRLGPQKYFILEPVTPEQEITHNSVQYYTDSTGTFTCQPSVSTAGFRALTPVDLPFDDPVELPLQYGIE